MPLPQNDPEADEALRIKVRLGHLSEDLHDALDGHRGAYDRTVLAVRGTRDGALDAARRAHEREAGPLRARLAELGPDPAGPPEAEAQDAPLGPRPIVPAEGRTPEDLFPPGQAPPPGTTAWLVPHVDPETGGFLPALRRLGLGLKALDAAVPAALVPFRDLPYPPTADNPAPYDPLPDGFGAALLRVRDDAAVVGSLVGHQGHNDFYEPVVADVFFGVLDAAVSGLAAGHSTAGYDLRPVMLRVVRDALDGLLQLVDEGHDIRDIGFVPDRVPTLDELAEAPPPGDGASVRAQTWDLARRASDEASEN